jgi:uncharacterized iron-regulated protein
MPGVMRLSFKLCLLLLALLQASCAGLAGGGRSGFWIDVYRGEPLTYEDMLEDLAESRVVYLGERHTLDRHHAIQEQIVTSLAGAGVALVLGLEQVEAFNQAALDRYCQGEIDFDELAQQTEWAKRWSNYEQYRPVLEAARQAGAPILALNARKETVRQVARQGIDGLDSETRRELPDEINLDDPLYEQHMKRVMMVHAMVTPEMVRRMFEAQVTRDETMADRLCAFLESEQGRERTAVVLCGAGHVSHRLGIPERVRRRMPGIRDRIVVLSESGDVELTERQQAMSRDITITHEQLRELDRPIADYLHAVSLNEESESDGE